MPIYPGAKFIASYDAGRGQRYYLFGINTDFAQIVAFYRTSLKQRGDLVFEAPPIHMFEVGRFREETMACLPCSRSDSATGSWAASLPGSQRSSSSRKAT